MFDPIVWDNLKVVLEGAIYDLDIDGEISIINRNDIVNLAKMSRLYEITFKLSNMVPDYPQASIKLFTDLDNIALELQGVSSKRKPGCKLEIKFLTVQRTIDDQCAKVDKFAQEVWGDTRQFEQKLSFLYSKEQTIYTNELTIAFDRDIYEENIDDLLDMVPYIIDTLIFLNKN